jgi:feruloyl esterase
LLGAAALAACDAQDGHADGVIGDPETCGFRPQTLQCPAAAQGRRAPAGHCLKPAQVEAATRIYAGPRTTRGQAWSSGGSPVGSEFTWEKSLLAQAGKPAFFQSIVDNWLRYLAFEPDPPLPSVAASGKDSRPSLALNFDAGPAQFAATAAVAGFRPDLERFRSLGGRLLVYHGWADESLMPAHTLDYWREVRQRQGGAQGASRGGDERLGEFARLFMVPGMLHCGGGPGAADIDFLTALERWVEAGEPPASLVAYKVNDAVPTFVRQPRFPLAPAAVQYTRQVFPYPGTGP